MWTKADVAKGCLQGEGKVPGQTPGCNESGVQRKHERLDTVEESESERTRTVKPSRKKSIK